MAPGDVKDCLKHDMTLVLQGARKCLKWQNVLLMKVQIIMAFILTILRLFFGQQKFIKILAIPNIEQRGESNLILLLVHCCIAARALL